MTHTHYYNYYNDDYHHYHHHNHHHHHTHHHHVILCNRSAVGSCSQRIVKTLLTLRCQDERGDDRIDDDDRLDDDDG